MGALVALKRNVELEAPSEKVDHYAKALAEEVLRLDWKNGRLYMKWMNEHFHIVRRTMRYINMAAGLSDIQDEKSYQHWIHHLKEEINHHKVLEKDAERFGLKVTETEPLPVTKALIQVVYSGMLDSKGAYLFGYGALLEGLACHAAAKMAEQVESKFEKGSAKFLRLHADVDDGEDGHYIGMKKHMDAMPPAEQAAIRDAIEVTYSLYSEILRQVSK